MFDFDWNAEKVELLTAWWKEGKSGSEIGARLGCSRCAVLGKIHRLSLEGANTKGPMVASVAPPPVPKPKPVAVASIPHQARTKQPAMPKRAAERPAPLPRPAPVAQPTQSLPGTAPVPLMEMTGCKWPVNDGYPVYLFCNAARCNERYCEAHEKQSGGYLSPFSAVEDNLIKEKWDYGRGLDWLGLKLGKHKATINSRAMRLRLPRAA